ncbi:MAG TPA: preprotein translocase subunit YajC [Nitratifractor salsuginis]|uniref:Sec translocon accessory complex subunit YajC n=1 Tax=Nitratifractor salsuginis TaxID=269261 RepID=A0A7V2WLX4_9BACT|nr:preprotein translocase subunit YajC [Nitratifractor salsuginis]
MSQGALAQFLPLILLFVIFWFLIIRPQQKQQKAHKEMLASLKKGDRIVTAGGLIAEVVKPEEEYLKIKINDDTVVRLERSYVARKIETA